MILIFFILIKKDLYTACKYSTTFFFKKQKIVLSKLNLNLKKKDMCKALNL
jgi:hypothetical protein